jgi:hypothetical protein
MLDERWEIKGMTAAKKLGEKMGAIMVKSKGMLVAMALGKTIKLWYWKVRGWEMWQC